MTPTKTTVTSWVAEVLEALPADAHEARTALGCVAAEYFRMDEALKRASAVQNSLRSVLLEAEERVQLKVVTNAWPTISNQEQHNE